MKPYKYRIVEKKKGRFELEYRENDLLTSLLNYLFDNEYRISNLNYSLPSGYYEGDLKSAREHFKKEIDKIQNYPKHYKL